MRKLVIAAAASAACTTTTVEMKLAIPNNDMTDTSCVTAVEVRALGTRYQQDPTDFTTSCLELTAANLTTLDVAMRDKYVVSMPSSGLSAIEVRAWSGHQACNKTSFMPFFTPDLIFYATETYIGQDTILLPITENLKCAGRANVDVHVTDMFTLVSGANPTDANCATATMVTNGSNTNTAQWVYRGTIVAEPFENGAQYYGDNDGAPFTSGLASFTTYTTAGAHSCLTLDGGNDTGGSTSCQLDSPVCAGGGRPNEKELAAIPTTINGATMQLEPDLTAKFPGVVFGSVWTGTAPKHPVTGATVTIDPNQGKVIYIDPPVAPAATPIVRADQSGTGASGLFLLYTNTVASVTVNAGAKSRQVTLSAVASSNAGALILVN
jgi:hypothetical protein